MSSILVQPVIMAGGSGTRLWPLSRAQYPKQFLVLDQLRELKGLPDATLLLEPVGRNTAPAMTLAALHATAGGADPVLVVTPADQTVTDDAA